MEIPDDPVFTSHAALIAWAMEGANMAASDKQMQLQVLDRIRRVMLAHAHLFPPKEPHP